MKINGDGVEVNKEDQQKINTFSRFNMQYHELIRVSLAHKEELTRLNDGLDEMVLMEDDEVVPYKFGDSFVRVTVEKARSLIEGNIQQLKNQVEEDVKKADDIHKKMMNLKAKLYTRFGNQINLDDE